MAPYDHMLLVVEHKIAQTHENHPPLPMGYSKLEPKFNLGRIVATPGVMSLGIDLIPFIRRHHCGEWGDLCANDKEANDLALTNGERILSKYHVVAASGTRVSIYVITEWDRRITTILLTEEY